MKTTQENKKFHCYLVVGNVVIEDGEEIHAIPQNAMIKTDDQNLGRYQLTKAQQALQVQTFQKMGEVYKVVDVIFTNIIHLGHMTDEEFMAMPDGVGMKERTEADPFEEITAVAQADA